jgi:hypothetical protein
VCGRSASRPANLVGQPFVLEEPEPLYAARIADASDLRHRFEPAEEVVVVIERVVEQHEIGVDDASVRDAPEEPPAQEYLRRPLSGTLCRDVLSLAGYVASPSIGSLVSNEGRCVCGWTAITVPAAIGPLPVKDALGQRAQALVADAEERKRMENVAG